jgi:23S rRNA pseudouridine1911/1915/1917 synthase
VRPVLQRLGFRRQALHAAVLGFVHPVTLDRLRFTSDLPNDMKELIDETAHSNRRNAPHKVF